MTKDTPSFVVKAAARLICLRNIDGGLFMVDPADRDEMKACIESWTSFMTFAMRNGKFASAALHANNIAKLAAELGASK